MGALALVEGQSSGRKVSEMLIALIERCDPIAAEREELFHRDNTQYDRPSTHASVFHRRNLNVEKNLYTALPVQVFLRLSFRCTNGTRCLPWK